MDEMPEEAAAPAEVTREIRVVETTEKEADRKFILALSMIVAFAVMLIIPILTNNASLFKDVAATLSGFVGTIIGYYFGTTKEES